MSHANTLKHIAITPHSSVPLDASVMRHSSVIHSNELARIKDDLDRYTQAQSNTNRRAIQQVHLFRLILQYQEEKLQKRVAKIEVQRKKKEQEKFERFKAIEEDRRRIDQIEEDYRNYQNRELVK